MPNSANNSTPLSEVDLGKRLELVRSLRLYVKKRGTVAEFAREHGIPRTTLISWCNGHNEPRGRPRKLGIFNETMILKIMCEEKIAHSWKTVQELVRQQAGDRLQRRSIFRLLKKWGLGVEQTPTNGIHTITANEWIQPAESVDQGHKALHQTIWRLISGRGMECFMLTSDDSRTNVERVSAVMAERLRGRKMQVQTNHRELADVLRNVLPNWEVTLF